MPQLKVIALYLPQFHPIPENDLWWGKGFTEWTNVTRAKQLFPGHQQPHLPADLGFYDLRLPEGRDAQAALARENGVHGFCYYHYWFNGTRLLERPFREVLASGKPDFPFCLCWANETWSRRWLGEEAQILLKQTYSAEDDIAHAEWLVQAFADPRYIQVDGRALFLVYRPASLPEPRRTLDRIRETCSRNGIRDPYLVGVDGHSAGADMRVLGFDSTLQFQPQLGALPLAFQDGWSLARLRTNRHLGVWNGRLRVYDDKQARDLMRYPVDHPHIPCVYVSWDNSPRRGRDGIVIINGSPESFGQELSATLRLAYNARPHEPVVFVNAWNEWAEGNHLEPDSRYGMQYLEQLRSVVSASV